MNQIREDLKKLKIKYKEALHKTTTKEEQIIIKQDYKEMKQKFKEANKIIKKNDLLESSEGFWDKFDFPKLDDFKTNTLNH